MLILTLTSSYRETCCKTESINSQSFLKIKNCSNCAPTLVYRRLLKKGQFVITFEEEGPDQMKNVCPEYTLPLSEETSRVRGWIRANTKIGPVLDVKVCCHQGRYGIEIMIESVQRHNYVLGSNCEQN